MTINPAALTDRKDQNQNLVNLTKVESFSEPPGFWKSIILDLLSVIAALTFGYSYFMYLTRGVSPWYVFGGLLFFCVLSVLQVFLARTIFRRVMIILAEVIVMAAAFFFYTPANVVLAAGGLVLAFLLWGYFSSRLVVKNQVEISFFGATRSVLGKVTTAALLFLLIVYAPQVQAGDNFIPRSNFRTLWSWSIGSLSNFYPGVPFSGTFGDFAKSFVTTQLAENPNFQALPSAAQATAVNQATAEFAASVAKVAGTRPTADTAVSDVAYDYLMGSVAGLRDRFDDRFLLLWVLVAFAILRTVGFLFVWLAQLVSLALYELLLAAGFMRIEGIPQTKEVVQY